MLWYKLKGHFVNLSVLAAILYFPSSWVSWTLALKTLKCMFRSFKHTICITYYVFFVKYDFWYYLFIYFFKIFFLLFYYIIKTAYSGIYAFPTILVNLNSCTNVCKVKLEMLNIKLEVQINIFWYFLLF